MGEMIKTSIKYCRKCISKNNGTWIEISFPEEMPNLASMEFYPDEIGKTVFLTREEAKAKLKEMEEKDGR